jgi:hypothetical protein
MLKWLEEPARADHPEVEVEIPTPASRWTKAISLSVATMPEGRVGVMVDTDATVEKVWATKLMQVLQ